MNDFTNMTDVLNHRQASILIPMLPYSVALESDFLEMLIPHDDGLYLPGMIFPTFYVGRLYFKRSEITIAPTGVVHYHLNSEGIDYHSKPIQDIADIPKSMEDIYDSQGNIVMTARNLFRFRKHLKLTPTIPVIPMRMAIGVAQRRINDLTKHSVVGGNRSDEIYHPANLFKKSYEHYLHRDEHMYAFHELLKVVDDFIQDDVWNIYTVAIKGMNLIMIKGIDYRIYKYYENLFEKKEQIEEGVISENPNVVSLQILESEEKNRTKKLLKQMIKGIAPMVVSTF